MIREIIGYASMVDVGGWRGGHGHESTIRDNETKQNPDGPAAQRGGPDRRTDHASIDQSNRMAAGLASRGQRRREGEGLGAERGPRDWTDGSISVGRSRDATHALRSSNDQVDASYVASPTAPT